MKLSKVKFDISLAEKVIDNKVPGIVVMNYKGNLSSGIYSITPLSIDKYTIRRRHVAGYSIVEIIDLEGIGVLNKDMYLEIHIRLEEFKDGDVFISTDEKEHISYGVYNSSISDDMSIGVYFGVNMLGFLHTGNIPFWSTPSKSRLATKEETEYLMNELKIQKGLKWNSDKKEFVAINNFKPFDKILLKHIDGYYRPDLFKYQREDGHIFGMSSNGQEAIPYKGNEHLVNTKCELYDNYF